MINKTVLGKSAYLLLFYLAFWYVFLVIWSVNLVYRSGILAVWYTKSTKIPQIRTRRFGGDKALGAELLRGNSRRIAS